MRETKVIFIGTSAWLVVCNVILCEQRRQVNLDKDKSHHSCFFPWKLLRTSTV